MFDILKLIYSLRNEQPPTHLFVLDLLSPTSLNEVARDPLIVMDTVMFEHLKM